jgi:hypothetical protein
MDRFYLQKSQIKTTCLKRNEALKRAPEDPFFKHFI